MAYRNGRSNPILLRLGRNVTWISNDFRKYDYNLEVLKNSQIYTYMDALFSNSFFMERVIMFSHMSVRRVNGKHFINIHLYDRSYNYFVFKRKRFLRRLTRYYRSNRLFWLARYRARKKYNIRKRAISKLFLIVTRFIFPYIKYYHLIQFNRFTGTASPSHFLLAKYISSVVRKNNIIHALSVISKFEMELLVSEDDYVKLMISLKNYLLTIIHFIRIINFIFGNKDKFKSVLNSKESYHKRVAILLNKIRYQVGKRYGKKIRKLLTRKSLSVKIRRKLKKSDDKKNISKRLLRIEKRFSNKLPYRNLRSPLLIYSRKPVVRCMSNVYLYKYSKAFRTFILMAHYGLKSKSVNPSTFTYILLRRLKKRYKKKLYKLVKYRLRRTFYLSSVFRLKVRKLKRYKKRHLLKKRSVFVYNPQRTIKNRTNRRYKHFGRFSKSRIYIKRLKSKRRHFRVSSKLRNRILKYRLRLRLRGRWKATRYFVLKVKNVQRFKVLKYWFKRLKALGQSTFGNFRAFRNDYYRSRRFYINLFKKHIKQPKKPKKKFNKRLKWKQHKFRRRNRFNKFNKFKKFKKPSNKLFGIEKKILPYFFKYKRRRSKLFKRLIKKELKKYIKRVPLKRFKKLSFVYRQKRRARYGYKKYIPYKKHQICEGWFVSRKNRKRQLSYTKHPKFVRLIYTNRFRYRRRYRPRNRRRGHKRNSPKNTIKQLLRTRKRKRYYGYLPIKRKSKRRQSVVKKILRKYKVFFKSNQTIQRRSKLVKLSTNNKKLVNKRLKFFLKLQYMRKAYAERIKNWTKLKDIAKIKARRLPAKKIPRRKIVRLFKIRHKLKLRAIRRKQRNKRRKNRVLALKRSIVQNKAYVNRKWKRGYNRYNRYNRFNRFNRYNRFPKSNPKYLKLKLKIKRPKKVKNRLNRTVEHRNLIMGSVIKFHERYKMLALKIKFKDYLYGSENPIKSPILLFNVKKKTTDKYQSVNSDILSLRRKRVYKTSGLLLLAQFRKMRTLFNSRFFIQRVLRYFIKMKYNSLLSVMLVDIKKILGSTPIINITRIRRSWYHPILATKFIVLRLSYQYTLNEVIFPMLNELYRGRKDLRAFMIICAGRFTRKQRATCKIIRNEKIGLQTFDRNILYAFDKVRLRYGMCGIRLYFNIKPPIEKVDPLDVIVSEVDEGILKLPFRIYQKDENSKLIKNKTKKRARLLHPVE